MNISKGGRVSECPIFNELTFIDVCCLFLLSQHVKEMKRFDHEAPHGQTNSGRGATFRVTTTSGQSIGRAA